MDAAQDVAAGRTSTRLKVRAVERHQSSFEAVYVVGSVCPCGPAVRAVERLCAASVGALADTLPCAAFSAARPSNAELIKAVAAGAAAVAPVWPAVSDQAGSVRASKQTRLAR